ncbi:hypothetical protein Tco_0105367, partial [Tanacetum coccineum]
KLSSRGNTSVASMYQTLSYVPKLSFRDSARQYTNSDGDNAAPCLLKGLATPYLLQRLATPYLLKGLATPYLMRRLTTPYCNILYFQYNDTITDTGSDINVMPYRVYKELGREEVGVTTIIAKFLILDMPIDKDTPILVGRGFLYTCGSILNTIDRITSTFDEICHQTFRAAKTSLDTPESDIEDEEEYAFQRNKFGAPI